MSQQNPKLPSREGLKKIRRVIEERRSRKPSEGLVQIIYEITHDKSPAPKNKIAARPVLPDREL